MAQIIKMDTANSKLTIDITDKNNHGLNDVFSISKDGKDEDKGAILLSIRSIHYKKELYKPGHAQIELLLSKEPAMDIAAVMDAIKKYFMPSKMVKLDIKLNDKFPVKDYYICDMNIENRMLEYLNGEVKATQYKKVITIHAYSPDYFLTLTKYNKTYLGQTLSEIIRTKISGFTGLSLPEAKDLRLCHTTSTSDDAELKQPYLVQFDESFYDFAVRVAHRCGELFYYDNGKLVLGVDKDDLNSTKNDDTTDFSSTVLNLNPANFSYSNLPECAKKSVGQFPLSLICDDKKENTYYEPYVTDGGLYESAMTTNDDNLFTVDTKKHSLSKTNLWEPHWFELAHDAFQASSGDEALFTAIKDAANILMQGAATAGNKDVKISEDAKAAANKLFTAVGGVGPKCENLYNMFYHWIEDMEKKSSDSVQENLYNNTPPASKLGSCVTFSSVATADKYIVSGVECHITPFFRDSGIKQDKQGYITQTYSQTTDVKGKVTVFKLQESNKRTHKKEYQKKVYPPLYDIPHIRKAKPQQAIISNIADPLRMGRVQIRYPWSSEIFDREEKNKNETLTDEKKYKDNDKLKTITNASPWIAMTTPFTGNDNGGFLMSPNPGDFVMVDYEDGNIERPFVNGSLYKEKGSAPWGSTIISPAVNQYGKPHRSITSGGNGITFVDGQAKNYLANLLPGIGGMFAKMFGGNDDNLKGSKLGGGLILSDWYGMYNISMSSATRSINIDSPWGSVNMSAFTGIKINCPNGDIDIVGKNVNISAGNNLTLKSGTNIKKSGSDPGHDVACSSLTALGGFIMGGVTALSSLNSTTTAIFSSVKNFADCSFIRNVWEIIFRPVDGSLTIDSMRNVILQSGGGTANVPADTLSNESRPAKGSDFPGIFGPDGSAKKDAEDAERKKWEDGSWAFYYVAKRCQDACREYLDEVDELVKHAVSLKDKDFNRCRYIKEADWLKLKENSFGCKPFQCQTIPIQSLNALGIDVPEDSINKAVEAIRLEYEHRVLVYNRLKKIAKIKDMIKTKLKAINFIINPQDQNQKNVLKSIIGNITQDVLVEAIAGKVAGCEDSLLADGKLSEGICAAFDKTKYLTAWSKAIVIGITEKAIEKQKVTKKDPNAVAQPPHDTITNILANYEIGQAPADTGDKERGSAFMKGLGIGDMFSFDSGAKEWKFLGGASKLFNVNGKAGTRSIYDISQGKGSILLSANGAETLELSKDGRGWKNIHNAKGMTLKSIFDSLGIPTN